MELERIIETFVVLSPEPPHFTLREPTSKADFKVGMLVRHRLRRRVMMVCNLYPRACCQDRRDNQVLVQWLDRDGEPHSLDFCWWELLIIDKTYIA